MAHAVIVVSLALASAAMSALSAAGEHRAASRLGHPRRRRWRPQWLGFVLALVTTPLWLASWSLDVGAYFVQAAALHVGSLSVVQPLMVATLVFTLPLAAVECRRRPGTRDWAGTVLVSVGLALMLSTRRSEAGPMTATAGLYPALAAVVAGAAALVGVSVRMPPAARAALFGVAAGGLFGVGAALTKLVAGIAVDDGLAGLVTAWQGYALGLVSAASFVLQQRAYDDGQLATVMTAVVIFDPLTSYVLGVVGFGEPLPASAALLALGFLGISVLVAGVAVLARSPLLRQTAAAGAAARDRPS